MVDAVQTLAGRATAQPLARRDPSTGDVSVTSLAVGALAAYREMAEQSHFAPPQSPAWVEYWAKNVNPDMVLATVARNGGAVMALALEVVRKGPFRIARLPGGTHANGNFPPLRSGFSIQAHELRNLMSAIKTARPDIDLIALDRLLPELDGVSNPLLPLPHFKSPNVSLAVDLEGGFATLLARSSGKRKRKKYRSQARKFDTAGGHRRLEAQTPGEVDRLLDAFFAMKEMRFRKAGISNVFGDAGTQAFFRTLFSGALDQSPRPFILHGLEVGGTLRAVTGSSRRGSTLICEFGAIVEDELAQASPGDFLFFENIREACDDGLPVYDFSVGDELYKRLWCDIETRHLDVVVPLSAKGHVMALSARLLARLKTRVKNSPVAWKITKALRRRTAAVTAPAVTSDD